MNNTFVAVIGRPRTGTSLVCDLVKSCGFNFGKDAYYTDSLRAGRNEHPLIRTLIKMNDFYIAEAINTFKKQNINAAKCHTTNMCAWLEVFNNHFNELKVVVINRDYDNSVKSFIDTLKSSNYKKSLNYYSKVNEMLDGIVKNTNNYNILTLDFEDLLLKKDEPLIKLKNFLNSDTSIEELKDIIHPEAVINR